MSDVKRVSQEDLGDAKAQNDEKTKLIDAIEQQDLKALAVCLEKMAQWSDKSALRLILRAAIFAVIGYGHVETLEVFLKHTIGMEDVSVLGGNVFHRAISKGSLPLIQKMLDYGVDPLRRADLRNGLDGIQMAILGGRLEIVKELWERSPDINTVKRSRKYLIHATQLKKLHREEQALLIAEYILGKGVGGVEMKTAADQAKSMAWSELSDFIEGYHLAVQEKALLKKTLKAVPKSKQTPLKAKKSAIRI